MQHNLFAILVGDVLQLHSARNMLESSKIPRPIQTTFLFATWADSYMFFVCLSFLLFECDSVLYCCDVVVAESDGQLHILYPCKIFGVQKASLNLLFFFFVSFRFFWVYVIYQCFRTIRQWPATQMCPLIAIESQTLKSFVSTFTLNRISSCS